MTLRATVADLILADITDNQDMRVPVIQGLARPSLTIVAMDLKDLTIIDVKLYYRGIVALWLEPYP